MTVQSTLKVLRVLQAVYPQFYKNMPKDAADAVLDIWSTAFEGDETELVLLAVKAYIESDITGFPPAIGRVKEIMRFLTQPGKMSGSEAWNLVRKAMDKAYNAPAPAFKALPEDIRGIIGDWETLVDYSNMSSDSLNVAKANFLREYDKKIENNKRIDLLPDAAKKYRERMLSQPTDTPKQIAAE